MPHLEVYSIAAALGFNLKFYDLGEVHGALIAPDDGPAEMYVNAQDSAAEQRFTVAHELGHYVYGHRINRHLGDNEFERAASNFERVADAFAKALLAAVTTVSPALDVPIEYAESRIKNLDLITG